MTSNGVIIMAGGLGKRMKSTVPKVLHLFHNIPMLIRIKLNFIIKYIIHFIYDLNNFKKIILYTNFHQ